MGKLYEEKWYQKWAKISNMGKFPRLYRYRYRVVSVHHSRSQHVPVQVQAVPVQVQAVPVHPNRMQPLPVQVRGVPVKVCRKCPDCAVFVYLSLNSYTVSIRTLLND